MSRASNHFAVIALMMGAGLSPNEISCSERHLTDPDNDTAKTRLPKPHNDPDVAAAYRAERLRRKAENFKKRNP